MVQYFEGRDGLGACHRGQVEYNLCEMSSQRVRFTSHTSEPRLSTTAAFARRNNNINISQAILSIGEWLKDRLVALASMYKQKEEVMQITLLTETPKAVTKLNDSIDQFGDVLKSLISHIHK
ncbi:hypothetical protein O9G_005400 [Rozella allomycis CSF55]|uniref:Uncharacterized protein n=1 Tax=Rozella allomycis (strain CSF55) TaxID=988480 RepID=A0A075B4U3_ROZAC|nr:hypothetical protein O9G_005400 [Rozella allomycis CSF55]|eukprot:EPZ36490.1 hypothetical protein O9G_005400 [Rozella allomycis CSF55]